MKSKSPGKLEDLERLSPAIVEAFKHEDSATICSSCNKTTKFFDVVSTGDKLCPVCTHIKGYTPTSDCISYIDMFDPKDEELLKIALSIAEYEKLKSVGDKDNFMEILLTTELREQLSYIALQNQTGLNEVIIAGLGYFIATCRSKV